MAGIFSFKSHLDKDCLSRSPLRFASFGLFSLQSASGHPLGCSSEMVPKPKALRSKGISSHKCNRNLLSQYSQFLILSKLDFYFVSVNSKYHERLKAWTVETGMVALH